MTARIDKGSSLKDVIYSSMLNDILNGRYVPGVPFTEKELTEKYEISKSPIREALIELCNEGVLRSIPRYGYEVLKIEHKQVKDAKEARILLECGALESFFSRLGAAQADYLQSILENREEEPGLFSHWEVNSRFHIALMDCYGNTALVSMLSSSMRLMQRAYAQYQYNKWKKTSFTGRSVRHRELLECIRKSDKKGAVRTLREDIESFDTSFLL